MENQETTIEALWDKVRSYLDTRINLLKLKTIDKASGIISSVISVIVVVLIVFIFIVLLNIGIALFLGDLLGKAYYGFLIVAAFYGVIGLVLYAFRNKIIKTPIVNSLIKKFLD